MQLSEAFAFHLNNARRFVIRASATKPTLAAASLMGNEIAGVRDHVRTLCREHRVAADTLVMIAAQTAPLTTEQRAAFLSMANAMRASHDLPPARVGLDS